MDTKTVRLIEDVSSLYEDRPEDLCKALGSMLSESPNPYSALERSAIQFALRKAAAVAQKWLDFDKRLQEAQDAKSKLENGRPVGTLEQALNALLARYMAEEERIKARYKEEDERYRLHILDVNERIKRWQGRRDGCRINPLMMVDKRFRISQPKEPKQPK